MGCFIVCLGFSKKRKRRIRPSNKLISGDQVYGSYKHLDSQDVTQEDSAISEPDCSSQAKVDSSIKVKKKVTFNLNVKIYEPIPDEASHSEDKELGVENDAKKDKESTSVSYPPNYRYQNLRDSWDDEEEDEESYDLDGDDEDDDGDWEENEEDDKEEEELCRHLCCLSVESEAKRPAIEEDDEVEYRERGQYKCSVLNPVENLSQWREVKEKSKKHLILKMQSTKENLGVIMVEKKQEVEIIRQSLNLSPNCKLSSPLMQDIAIDASLSHWVLTSSAREFAQQC